LKIPFEANAFQISIPEGAFYVAEACAGLRFLIASIAFGALYAVTMFRSPWRRFAFIAVSCVVPVVANGVRGLGIVLLGHVLGSAQAGAADHLIYGWVFFSAVILLLAAGGLPFRQPPVPNPVPELSDAPRFSRLAGCVGVVVLALAAPGASQALFLSHPRATAVALPKFTMPEGCTADAPEHPSLSITVQEFECAAHTVRMTTAILARGTNPARILDTARIAAAAGLQGEIDTQAERIGGAPWVLMTARDNGGVAAYAVWIDGLQAAGGLHDRLKMARDLFSAGPPPVAVSVAVAPGHAGAREMLQGFLVNMK
jgi:exosortase/archaeosortase family protein